MDDDTVRLWLSDNRGWTTETLQRFQIGLLPPDIRGGPRRIAFPVYGADGKLSNIRRHLFAYQDGLDRTYKTLPWEKGLRSDLYPLSARKVGAAVLLVEGEADAVLACQLGFAALTGTLGAGSWKPEWTDALRGHAVTILYDNDKAGQDGAQKAAAALAGGGCAVRLAALPEGKGKDLTEWIVEHGGTAEDVQAAIDAATNYAPPEPAPACLTADLWPEADARNFFTASPGKSCASLNPTPKPIPSPCWCSFLPRSARPSGAAPISPPKPISTLETCSSFWSASVPKAAKELPGAISGGCLPWQTTQWENFCLQSGLSSGEGLIWHVRDAIEKPVKNKTTGLVELETVDLGVTDKRLLVQESEYASVLRVAGRDGNTLSALLRDAWDKGRLQTMTKNSAAKATGAHVSLIGHVTADELRRELSSTEAANGFANRFLWLCARRSKELPEGGSLQPEALYPLAVRLSAAIDAARQTGELRRDDAARALWHDVYHDLSEGEPGLAGAVTSRGEAQTMRLALLYALLDGSECIRRAHLVAALALWEYVQDSARYIFGDTLGDPIADDILRALRTRPDGMSRNDLRELFQRHQSSGRIGQALALLAKHHRARMVMQTDTGGRPAEHWYAVSAGEKTQPEGAR